MDLNDGRGIIIEDSRKVYWRDVSDDSEYKSKIHDLRWEVYIKDK